MKKHTKAKYISIIKEFNIDKKKEKIVSNKQSEIEIKDYETLLSSMVLIPAPSHLAEWNNEFKEISDTYVELMNYIKLEDDKLFVEPPYKIWSADLKIDFHIKGTKPVATIVYNRYIYIRIGEETRSFLNKRILILSDAFPKEKNDKGEVIFDIQKISAVYTQFMLMCYIVPKFDGFNLEIYSNKIKIIHRNNYCNGIKGKIVWKIPIQFSSEEETIVFSDYVFKK